MTSLQKCDLVIKPMNIVRGQGLYKLVVESKNSEEKKQEGL